MAKPYPRDLRERVVPVVEGGLSRRQAADEFNVGNFSATFVRCLWCGHADGNASHGLPRRRPLEHCDLSTLMIV